MKIPFNKPFLTGKEPLYILQAVYSEKISGNGMFTKKCQNFFESRYHFKKALLTTSCTDALEMAAILLNIDKDDEVILPSFTFVSTANAFLLRGAKIVFADSGKDNPNIDVASLESLITPKTKAIVPVHYAGVPCDMDAIMHLSKKYGLSVVEDAAQGIDSTYKGKPLGSIGDFGTFSFHETKNVISGEGGMLMVNNEHFHERSEIIWEKGTNRAAFFRGEVRKYEWVDIGSSFLPSEIVAAFLFAQLENIDLIQAKRKKLWKDYYERLLPLEKSGKISLPNIYDSSAINGHLFYIICSSEKCRTDLSSFLNERDILAIFHYIPLHSSPYYHRKHDGRQLPNADRFGQCLLRLPMYYDLSEKELETVVEAITKFFTN